MNCQSCGMPMAQDSDHGGGRPDNVYCTHCTDSAGNLKSREEVREGMITFYQQSMGKTREEAETAVNSHMAQMPAWAADRPAWSGASPVQPQPSIPINQPVGTVTPPPMGPPTQAPPPPPVAETEPEPAAEAQIGSVPPVPPMPSGETTPSEEQT